MEGPATLKQQPIMGGRIIASPDIPEIMDKLLAICEVVWITGMRTVKESELIEIAQSKCVGASGNVLFLTKDGIAVKVGDGHCVFIPITDKSTRNLIEDILLPVAQKLLPADDPKGVAMTASVDLLVKSEIEMKGYASLAGVEPLAPVNYHSLNQLMLCARGRLTKELGAMKFERPFPLDASESQLTFDISAPECHIGYLILNVDGNLLYHWHNIPWDTKFGALLQKFSSASKYYQAEDLFKSIRRRIADLHHPDHPVKLERFTLQVQLNLEILKKSKGHHFEAPRLLFSHRRGLKSTWLPLGNQEDLDFMLAKSKEIAMCPVLILPWHLRVAKILHDLNTLEEKENPPAPKLPAPVPTGVTSLGDLTKKLPSVTVLPLTHSVTPSPKGKGRATFTTGGDSDSSSSSNPAKTVTEARFTKEQKDKGVARDDEGRPV